jgi:MoaA/NifB/PqqE/SkfB family radical SAM enzyme
MKIVAFEIIERCNLYCDFCVRNASRQLRGLVTAERFTSRVRRVCADFPELELIALTGGEPFLHPEMSTLVHDAAARVPQVTITTNATVTSRTLVEQLARCKQLSLIISLDGPDPITHDGIRGSEGAYGRLVDFTALCRDSGLQFSVNVTVNEHNARRVYETACKAGELGADP